MTNGKTGRIALLTIALIGRVAAGVGGGAAGQAHAAAGIGCDRAQPLFHHWKSATALATWHWSGPTPTPLVWHWTGARLARQVQGLDAAHAHIDGLLPPDLGPLTLVARAQAHPLVGQMSPDALSSSAD